MKLLVLYQDKGIYYHNEHLHQLWLQKLAEVEDVLFYGPGMTNRYGNEVTTEFKAARDISEIVKGFEIDVVLIYTKDRMFYEYKPVTLFPSPNNIQWLNDTIKKVRVPIVCLENDYIYESNDVWYQEIGVDLILQRHYAQTLRQEKIEQQWLPFSVNIDVFNPGNQEERINKICFAGSLTRAYDIYRYRRGAIKKLEEAGLIDVYGKYEMTRNRYPKCLRGYTSHLCGSTKFRNSPSKTFEIMASGSILLTDRFKGIDKLFPEGSYVSYYDDFSDVVEKAEWILSNPARRKEIRKSAIDCILKRHTYEKRIQDLMKLLKDRYNL